MKVISAVQARNGKIKSVACTPVSLDTVFHHLTLHDSIEPAESFC